MTRRHAGDSAAVALDAVILAGGKGVRLERVLPGRQKVTAEVHGRTFVTYLIQYFAMLGVRRIVLALGHKPEQVLEAVAGLDATGCEIVPSIEPEPLGTGGALRLALGSTASDPVLVANGDSICGIDLPAFERFHRARGARMSLVLARVPDTSRYGTVILAPDGGIAAFREKDASRPEAGLVNAGVYLAGRDAVAAIPAGRAVSLETEVFPLYCGSGAYGLVQEAPFIDIGTPESLAAADAFMERFIARHLQR